MDSKVSSFDWDAATDMARIKARLVVGHYGITFSDAEDIEHELLLHLSEQMDHFDEKRGHQHAYMNRVLSRKLISIVRYHCAEQREYRRCTTSLNESTAGATGERTEVAETFSSDVDRRMKRSSANGVDLAIDLRLTFHGLDSDSREIVQMLEHWSLAEIARRLGLTRSAARWRVARLRRQLRDAGLDVYLDG